MKYSKLLTLLLVTGLATACNRHNTSPRLVYVSPPPHGTPVGSSSQGTLIIPEPEPPVPEGDVSDSLPDVQVPPAIQQTPRHIIHEPHHDSEASPVSSPQPSSEEENQASKLLRLEMKDSPEAGKVQSLQETIQQRISQLEKMGLSEAGSQTLKEARSFLDQSRDALKDADLQRSYNLARKAYLLVSALGQP